MVSVVSVGLLQIGTIFEVFGCGDYLDILGADNLGCLVYESGEGLLGGIRWEGQRWRHFGVKQSSSKWFVSIS